jgi:hypothetical protein
MEGIVSTDSRGTKILARTFFNDLRAGGYTPTQIIAVASELIDLVTSDIRGGDKAVAAAEAEKAAKPELTHGA